MKSELGAPGLCTRTGPCCTLRLASLEEAALFRWVRPQGDLRGLVA